MSKIAKDKGGGQGVPDELDAALAVVACTYPRSGATLSA